MVDQKDANASGEEQRRDEAFEHAQEMSSVAVFAVIDALLLACIALINVGLSSFLGHWEFTGVDAFVVRGMQWVVGATTIGSVTLRAIAGLTRQAKQAWREASR